MGVGLCIRGLANLYKTDCSGLFTETLTAQVKSVFSDETSLVGTQTTSRKAHVRNQSQNKVSNRLTIGESPFRIFWDERTKRRRVSW